MAKKLIKLDVAIKSTHQIWQMDIPKVYTNDLNSVRFDFNLIDVTEQEMLDGGGAANVRLRMKDGRLLPHVGETTISGTTVSYDLLEYKESLFGQAEIQLILKLGFQDFASQMFTFEIIKGLDIGNIGEIGYKNFLINTLNQYRLKVTQWVNEYQHFLIQNTKASGNMAINDLGLVGGSFVIDDPKTSYTPPTTSASEAQLLTIRGMLKNYIATRNVGFLTMSRKLTDALLNYYYPTFNIPAEPDASWVPHWLVNVTAPFVSREYFLNGVASFTNGIATVHYEKVFRIYSARTTESTLEYDWSPAAPVVGTEYEIEETTVMYGQSEATISLKDKTFNGNLLIVYSSETGRTIEVGEKCEAYPVWRPLNAGEIACAVDSLAWAIDVFDLWYQIDGDEKWLRAVHSTRLSIKEVAEVSNTKYHLRYGEVGTDVLKNGVTSFSVRSPQETYTNEGSMILIDYPQSAGNDEASIGTWAGNRLPFAPNGWVEVKLGSDHARKVRVSIDEDSVYAPEKRWIHEFITSGSGLNAKETIAIRADEFYKTDDIFWGSHYGKSTDADPVVSANSSLTKTIVTDLIESKKVEVTSVSMTRGDEGGWTGWSQLMLAAWGRKLPFTIKYKTESNIIFAINDSENVKWTYLLPKTGNGYGEVRLTEDLFSGGTEFGTGSYLSVLIEAVDDVCSINLDYLGTKTILDKDYYTSISLSYAQQEALKIGLEYLKPAPSRDPLPYAPYILPFDMHYINYELSNLRGAIYSGYQAPWVFQDDVFTDGDAAVDTNLQFLLDSQNAYEALTGVGGFFAPIFWWNYENDSGNNEPNTFGIVGKWGDIWGGFQYRTFSDIARIFEKDEDNQEAYTLILKFIHAVDRYWKDTFTDFPTAFVLGREPYNDQTDPQMVSNFMRGLISGLHSKRLTYEEKSLLIKLVRKCLEYLDYYHLPIATDFNDSEVEGTFSPDPLNKTWYGYWGGEILSALSAFQSLE